MLPLAPHLVDAGLESDRLVRIERAFVLDDGTLVADDEETFVDFLGQPVHNGPVSLDDVVMAGLAVSDDQFAIDGMNPNKGLRHAFNALEKHVSLGREPQKRLHLSSPTS